MLGPRNVQYVPKTPVIKGVNPSLYGFGYRPRFGSIEKHRQYIHIVEPEFGVNWTAKCVCRTFSDIVMKK